MSRVLAYLALFGLALLLQTVIFPPFSPAGIKPDLVLLLVVWMGLREPPRRGGLLVYAIGWLYDAHAGTFPGLHGFILLTIFLVIRGMATRLNTESLSLLWCLVGGATLLQALLTVFALEFFDESSRFWALMLRTVPAQLLVNLAAGYLLRNVGLRIRRSGVLFPSPVTALVGKRRET